MLRSVSFMNARSLAGASALASSDVGHRRAAIELSIFKLPRHWGFLVCSGISTLMDTLERATPTDEELKQARATGCVSPAFAELLKGSACTIDVNVPSDGTLLFADDPIATLEGPLWQVWLFADAVRAVLVPASVIATRTARLVVSAGKTDIVDATSARVADPFRAIRVARAAFIGGARSTQSAVAAAALGIELNNSPPPDALSLIDADDLQRAEGWSFQTTSTNVVVNLGPGDDEEETLAEMRRIALRTIGWGATGLTNDVAGLDIRPQLVALEQKGVWTPRMGAIPDVTVSPGRKLVVRYTDRAGRQLADVMHGVTERIQPASEAVLVGYHGSGLTLPVEGATSGVPLLSSILRSGRRVGADEPIERSRQRVREALDALPQSFKRLRHPLPFPVGITQSLAALKSEMASTFG